MRRTPQFVFVLAAALLLASLTSAPSSSALGSSGGKSTKGAPVADVYTPVTASVIGPPTYPVPGTDKKYHVTYDLELQNAATIPATLQKVEVVDEAKPSRVLDTYEGDPLLQRLRTLRGGAGTVADTAIEPSGARILYVDLTFDSLDQAPKKVLHHLSVVGPRSPVGPAATEPTQIDYTITPYDISTGKRIVLAPPVKGSGWVAINGCCDVGSAHRSALGAFDGEVFNPQLFAIDWKRMNDQGAFFTGDPTKNESYVDYGSKVYAVADGTVVKTLDTLTPNTPGVLPAMDPVQAQQLTPETADGNNIVLDLGHGVFVFYAHLQKGTLKVKPGDKVKKGDVLALLGNTGNANASHLHIHVMDGPAVLGSHGLPYVISGFQYDGQVPQTIADADNYLTGNFGADRLPKPQARKNELPLGLAIVNFPG